MSSIMLKFVRLFSCYPNIFYTQLATSLAVAVPIYALVIVVIARNRKQEPFNSTFFQADISSGPNRHLVLFARLQFREIPGVRFLHRHGILDGDRSESMVSSQHSGHIRASCPCRFATLAIFLHYAHFAQSVQRALLCRREFPWKGTKKEP